MLSKTSNYIQTWVRPEWWGGGPGLPDSTAALQAAIDNAAASAITDAKTVLLLPGIYYVSNLTLKNNVTLQGFPGSEIQALNSGDSHYLIASSTYTANSAFANAPANIFGCRINAAGYKENSVILRAYSSIFENNTIFGATINDLLITANSKDGTLPAGTMVENRFFNNRFGASGYTPAYSVRVSDTSLNKATDNWFTDNIFRGAATTANFYCMTGAGMQMKGNHFYGGSVSAIFESIGVGSNITDNYFEGKVKINSGGGGVAAKIGPGNYFADDVEAYFLILASNHTVSAGNTYGPQAFMQHGYIGATRIFISKGDTFHTVSNPFQFLTVGSVGQYLVQNAYYVPANRIINAVIDGNTQSTFDVLSSAFTTAGLTPTVGLYGNKGVPKASVSSAPAYLGEMALIAPNIYIAKGVAAASDWEKVAKEKIYTMNTQVVCPADTAENEVVSLTVPGGVLGPNGYLSIKAQLGVNNNANAKTYRIKINGTTINSGNAASGLTYRISAEMFNRNNVSAQIMQAAGQVGYGIFGTAAQTFAINTSVDMIISMTLQKASAGDTLTVEAFSVEVHHAD